MNELFAIKHEELLTEFNRYILEHPEFLEDIPDNALLVFIDRTDPEFSRYNLERAMEHRQHDDQPDRPVVYIDVGELAPIHSRLVSPHILPEFPDFMAV
jgi:Family of unknown function (DUF5647)